MPIPSVITDLSATAGSNSPAGSDSPTEGDNYIRALSAILRTEYDDRLSQNVFAASLSATAGASMVGWVQTGSHTLRTIQSKLQERISLKDFGAVGDGVTDDSSAISAALSATGAALFIPAGTYLYNSTMPAPVCSAIYGDGELVSILKPGTGLSRGLSIGGTNYPMLLRDFQILGTSATTATGLYVGEAASCAPNIHNVRVYGFGGVGGIGIRIGHYLKGKITKLTSELNSINMVVQQPSASGNPTTLHFDSCVFTTTDPTNGTYGVVIRDSDGLVFTNCDFESSKNEGLYIETATASRDILNIVVGPGCRFEDNNSAGGVNSYHMTVSSNTGTRTVRGITVDSAYFILTTALRAQRSVKFDGQDIRQYQLLRYNPNTDHSAETVTVSNGATGKIDLWPSWLSYGDNVNVDSTSVDYGEYGKNRTTRYNTAAPTVASANTITIANVPVTFISGTTLIKTINVPTAWVGTANYGGKITLIPTGAWTWDATGNIAVAGTAVVSKALDLIFDKGTGKWYPSYT